MIYLIRSWGPVFHQVLGDEFATQYLPHLTKEQHESLVMGATYLDGLPKRKFHDLTYLVELIKEIENTTTPEYYFHLGLILHITVDICGHMGYPDSFLPIKRPYHYIAEMIACSAVLHDRNPPNLPLNDLSKGIVRKLSNRNAATFATLCKFYRFIASLGFRSFLSTIENDQKGNPCKKTMSFYNLEVHINSIKALMYDTICMLNDGILEYNVLYDHCRKELRTLLIC